MPQHVFSLLQLQDWAGHGPFTAVLLRAQLQTFVAFVGAWIGGHQIAQLTEVRFAGWQEDIEAL